MRERDKTKLIDVTIKQVQQPAIMICLQKKWAMIDTHEMYTSFQVALDLVLTLNFMSIQFSLESTNIQLFLLIVRYNLPLMKLWFYRNEYI